MMYVKKKTQTNGTMKKVIFNINDKIQLFAALWW